MPLIVSVIAAGILIGLPLAGIAAAGLDISGFLEFPPLTRYVPHAGFSWPIFLSIAVVDLLLVSGLVYLIYHGMQRIGKVPRAEKVALPWWGWAGVLIGMAGWVLAWTRFEWFSGFQQHTFTLPWSGYILVINGLCVKRSSRSPLTDNPKTFMLLFPLSAVFWWFFEYLNRFVQNWYYVGIDDFGSVEYTLFASLSFSTVLPAVLSTYALLMTWPAFRHGLKTGLTINVQQPRQLAAAVLVLSGAGLSLIGICPDYLFPLLWVSPLLIISSLQTLLGYDNIFVPIRSGDWRTVAGSAIAALICGFFWELWNYHSLAHWVYAVPFVSRFHVFEMPILGYGGYLPFGLECLVAAGLFRTFRSTFQAG